MIGGAPVNEAFRAQIGADAAALENMSDIGAKTVGDVRAGRRQIQQRRTE